MNQRNIFSLFANDSVNKNGTQAARGRRGGKVEID